MIRERAIPKSAPRVVRREMIWLMKDILNSSALFSGRLWILILSIEVFEGFLGPI